MTVILLFLKHNSDTAYGHAYGLRETYNRYTSYYQQGQYTKAIQYLTEAKRLAKEEFGPDHPTTATIINDLAELHKAQGNYAEAEPLLLRAIAIWENALGPEHPIVANSLENYAALLRKLRRADEAVKVEARAKAIRPTYE